jgi:hypothetical protein
MGDREGQNTQLPKFNIMPKIVISVVTGISWFIFLILWLYFFAERISVYKNLAIVLLSILILGIINSVTWIPFGIMRRRE